MSEWEEKLNTLLSDPDAMAQVMNIAQNLSQQMGQLRGEHLHEPLPVARLQERLRYGRIALELVDELLRAVIHSCASVSCLSRQYMTVGRKLCRCGKISENFRNP